MTKPTQAPDPIDVGAQEADAGAGSPKKKPKAKADHQIDIRAALEAPVRVTQDGRSRPMSAFEAMLRRHLRKSLVEKSVPSMQFIIEQAARHQIVKTPPAPRGGGVFVVPKGLPEEVEREIFGEPPEADEPEPMSRIAGILRRFYDGLKGRSERE